MSRILESDQGLLHLRHARRTGLQGIAEANRSLEASQTEYAKCSTDPNADISALVP